MPSRRSLVARMLALISALSLPLVQIPTTARAGTFQAPVRTPANLPAGSEVVRVGLPNLSLSQPLNPAPSLQASLNAALAPALPQASMPVEVPKHPVLAYLDALKAQGIALPETFQGPRDIQRLKEAAERLPDSPVKAEILAFAQAVSLPEGAARASAIAGVYDRSVVKAPGLIPAADGAPDQFWTYVSNLLPAGRLQKFAAARAKRNAVPPPALDPANFRVPPVKGRWIPPAASLPASTREIPGVDKQIVGQDEALKALEFGLKMPMKARDYNVYVAGPDGSGRETAVKHILKDLAPRMPTPPDSVTITNLVDKGKPRQFYIPPGVGPALQAGLKELVETLKSAIPQALQNREFVAQKKKMHDDWKKPAQAAAGRAIAEAQPALEALRDERFGAEIHADVEEGALRWNVTARDAQGRWRGLSKEEVNAKIEAGEFTSQDWDKKFEELQGKIAPILQKIVPVIQKIAEEHAEVHQKMAMADRKAAAGVVSELGAPVAALLSPQPSHDGEAHKALEAAHQARVEAFEKEKGTVKIGRFEAQFVEVEAETPLGKLKIPMAQVTLEGRELSQEEADALASGPETRREWAELQKGAAAAQKAYIAGKKALIQRFMKEHKALHAKDAAPDPQAREAQTALLELIADMVRNYDDFLPLQLPDDANPLMAMMAQQQRTDPAEKYKVNVLATNEPGSGAPFVLAKSVTFEEFNGTVDDKAKVSMMGGMALKHEEPGGPTLKGGLIHKAHGGFLVIDVMDLLRVPGLYESVMRMLRSGQAEIPEEGLLSVLRQHGASHKVALPQGVKIVLIGSSWIKMLLEHYDEEFARYFKSQVSFQSSLEITAEVIGGYLQFIKKMILTKADEVLDMSREAIGGVLEHAAVLAESNEKLSARFGPLLDLLREASHWARLDGRKEVNGADVALALQAKREREGYIERRTHEAYIKDVYHFDSEGSKPAVINGMAVMGDFGVPTRGTAVLSVGKPGIISVDEQTGMAGPSYVRAVREAESYLLETYGKDKPLGTSIRLVEEQMYGGIDGDSGTMKKILLAELALAGIDIRQDFAVTGSADQQGRVQAIGGVNYKISGVYDIVKAKRGLSKEKPFHFIIPFDNLAELALRRDILEAWERGEIEIYAVTHVRQAEELISGGVPYAEIHRQADERLRKDFMIAAKGPKTAGGH